jgi:hypothetical protein
MFSAETEQVASNSNVVQEVTGLAIGWDTLLSEVSVFFLCRAKKIS